MTAPGTGSGAGEYGRAVRTTAGSGAVYRYHGAIATAGETTTHRTQHATKETKTRNNKTTVYAHTCVCVSRGPLHASVRRSEQRPWQYECSSTLTSTSASTSTSTSASQTSRVSQASPRAGTQLRRSQPSVAMRARSGKAKLELHGGQHGSTVQRPCVSAGSWILCMGCVRGTRCAVRRGVAMDYCDGFLRWSTATGARRP